MTRYLRCITYKVHKLLHYDGLTDVNMFIGEIILPKGHRFHALDLGIRATLVIWWETHKENMCNWDECAHMMRLRFKCPTIQMEEVYSRNYDPCCKTPIIHSITR